jgi:hypothetical protein
MYQAPNAFGAFASPARGGFRGGSTSASWICLAAAVALALALVMPAGALLGGGRSSSGSSTFQGAAAWGRREGFTSVKSTFPYGDRVARQVPLESLALVHAKTGGYSVANTLLEGSKRRRELAAGAVGAAGASGAASGAVSGPSGVAPERNLVRPLDAASSTATAPRVETPAPNGNPTAGGTAAAGGNPTADDTVAVVGGQPVRWNAATGAWVTITPTQQGNQQLPPPVPAPVTQQPVVAPAPNGNPTAGGTAAAGGNPTADDTVAVVGGQPVRWNAATGAWVTITPTQQGNQQLPPPVPAPPVPAPVLPLASSEVFIASSSVGVTAVRSLKFDGVTLDRAWLSSPARKITCQGCSGPANGGRQVSLLDACLAADGTVTVGGVQRKVYGLSFAFRGTTVRFADRASGYAYYPGKLALVASLAEKTVGSNGDLIRIRYFGAINASGKLDERAYGQFGKTDAPDTWAFRRVHLATGAESFCMFSTPECSVTGRNGETTPFFVLYTSKYGGPEGVALSSELGVANDTCEPVKVLERHLNAMAWWSFQ